MNAEQWGPTAIKAIRYTFGIPYGDFNVRRFLTSTLLFLFLFLQPTLAAILTVSVTGQLKSIQLAVELAHPGDTIFVQKGTYREGNMIIRKPLTIIGLDFPVLDGELKYEIFTVAADNVTLEGFRMINTGIASISDIAAVKGLDVSRLRVINNQFENTFFGIHLSNSNNCLIEGNTLSSNALSEHQIGNGIHLWKCDHITISRNQIHGHRDGIYFEFVTNSLVS